MNAARNRLSSESGRAVFTLSLDCEGLWGMADQISVVKARIVNDRGLENAYQFLLTTLDRNNIKATAAFVTCFAVDAEVLRGNMDLLERLASLNPSWFSSVLSAFQADSLDGWRGAGFYQRMEAAGHEMAWHGTTHQSLSDHAHPEAILLELELTTRLFETLRTRPRTIVFPRNTVGQLPLLRKFGFDTYRDRLAAGLPDRVAQLAREWNVFDAHVMEMPRRVDGWHVAPAGYFLNWPSGVRSLIPVAATVSRWKSLLRNAAHSGGYVHMWFHPHNLVTAPAMRIAFEEIIRFAGELVKTGDITNLTMADANLRCDSGARE